MSVHRGPENTPSGNAFIRQLANTPIGWGLAGSHSINPCLGHVFFSRLEPGWLTRQGSLCKVMETLRGGWRTQIGMWEWKENEEGEVKLGHLKRRAGGERSNWYETVYMFVPSGDTGLDIHSLTVNVTQLFSFKYTLIHRSEFNSSRPIKNPIGTALEDFI